MAKKEKGEESLRGKMITMSYPEFIVDEMTRKFTFELSEGGWGIKVTSKNNTKYSWTKDSAVLETYVDFIDFICRFTINEMPRGTHYSLYAQRMENAMLTIKDIVDRYGHTGNGYKPGLFINDEPRILDDNLKKQLSECWG